ncbi:MAG: deoxyguanosinetriphosphate triphosphohydrolase [Notoacmeibacter sp.]|nr:deoxyguanosinetriphosphate triphosphohydrolase [Notoacmeibacter sp.]
MELGDIGFGYRPRAPFASDPAHSRGRFYAETESRTRTPFQRDRDRIIHSTAFRRLKHKTQVFVAHEGDHFRTRLTHTIEVAQIARAIARALKVDEDLAEAVALVHDFGHTPFGHTGEDALNSKMAEFGGFDHNAQSLRVVTRLECRYAEFDGLNLTWETLEGLVKHNGPLLKADGSPAGKPVPQTILDFDQMFPIGLATHAGAEAQAAAIADDIAYNTHDIDDGVRAGLFDLEDLESEVPFVAEILGDVRARYPGLEAVRMSYEFQRRQITAMVEDVIATAQEALARINPQSVDELRACGETVVGFSAAMRETDRALKTFLFARMYRHPSVVEVRKQVDRIVRELFDAYMADPRAMPQGWREGLDHASQKARARHVADFLAGMTDNYALAEYERLFDRKLHLG